MEVHVELNTTPHTSIKQSPRLEVLMSWWGMENLFTDRNELSTREKVQMIAEAGYDGINGMIPEKSEAEKWFQLLDEYNLSFSVNAYPKTIDDLQDFIQEAKQYNQINFINTQVMRPFLTGNQAIDLLKEMQDLSDALDAGVFIETHRGTITQDLIRTVDYVNKIPNLNLTIDLSHYIVAGEMKEIDDEADFLIHQLLKHTSSIHARISNGEQIQVDVPHSEWDVQKEGSLVNHFQSWWLTGMRNWHQEGKRDIFPFVCELGPPPYAMTIPRDENGSYEPGDRWTQSKWFMKCARTLWEQV